MKRKTFPFSVIMALLTSSLALRAQTAPTPASPPTPTASSTTSLTPSATTTAPMRPRAVSPETAAALSAARPKFDPAKSADAPKKPEAPVPDLRETDKPANGIPRLPDFVVRQAKDPTLRERDAYTPEGVANLARKRYLGETGSALNRWNIFGVHRAVGPDGATGQAVAMYQEDERLKNIAELKEDAGLVSARDKAAGAYIRREAVKTYERTDDFGWRNTTNK